MKSLSILGGKVHVVELPEEAKEYHIAQDYQGSYLCWDDGTTDFERQQFGDHGQFKFCDNPRNNWRIVSTLVDLTEEQAAVLVQKRIHPWDHKLWTYRDYTREHKFPRDAVVLHTALQSLESAIVAEGYGFENKLTNPEKFCYFSRDRMIEDVKEWHEAQSRVLCRERTLILRRVDL